MGDTIEDAINLALDKAERRPQDEDTDYLEMTILALRIAKKLYRKHNEALLEDDDQ